MTITMSSIYRSLVAAATVAGFGLVFLLTTGAAAAETHCVVQVIGQKDSGEFILSEEVCFDDFDKMTRHVEQVEAGIESNFIIGVHYEHSDRRGSSFSVQGSRCTGWVAQRAFVVERSDFVDHERV